MIEKISEGGIIGHANDRVVVAGGWSSTPGDPPPINTPLVYDLDNFL
jgi:hypothetical protein